MVRSCAGWEVGKEHVDQEAERLRDKELEQEREAEVRRERGPRFELQVHQIRMKRNIMAYPLH